MSSSVFKRNSVLLFLSWRSAGIFVNFLFSNSLSLEDNGDATWNVNYVCDADISGFQFNVEGATVSGASGGDATANGFMLSSNSTTVIGFSLSASEMIR